MASAGSAATPTFEEQLAELERVVEQLERGDLSLEDSVSLFERGMRLSEACKGQLASAESRIQVLLHPREKGPVRVQEMELPAEDGERDEDDVEPMDEE